MGLRLGELWRNFRGAALGDQEQGAEQPQCADAENPVPEPLQSTMNCPPASTLAASLPASVMRADYPLTSNHYIVSDPHDQAAIDNIVYHAVCEKRASMEPGAKLYAVMGDEHTNPVHHMTQAGLLENIALSQNNKDGSDHGKLLCAMELPYNYLAKYMHYAYALSAEPMKNVLQDYDMEGVRFVRAVLGDNVFHYAPQSEGRIYQTCLNHHITSVNIDADYHFITEEREEIVRDDPVVRMIYGDTDTVPEMPSPRSAEGMMLRNATMAMRAWQAATQSHKADTIVISTGLGHVAGLENHGYRYRSSLCKFLDVKIDGKGQILPIIFGVQNVQMRRDIDQQVWVDFPDAIIIEGASEESFSLKKEFNSAGKARFVNAKEARLIKDQEESFIQKLGQSYGVNTPQRFQMVRPPKMSVVRKELSEFLERAKSLHIHKNDGSDQDNSPVL